MSGDYWDGGIFSKEAVTKRFIIGLKVLRAVLNSWNNNSIIELIGEFSQNKEF